MKDCNHTNPRRTAAASVHANIAMPDCRILDTRTSGGYETQLANLLFLRADDEWGYDPSFAFSTSVNWLGAARVF